VEVGSDRVQIWSHSYPGYPSPYFRPEFRMGSSPPMPFIKNVYSRYRCLVAHSGFTGGQRAGRTFLIVSYAWSLGMPFQIISAPLFLSGREQLRTRYALISLVYASF
jgi:hypothetical protein